MDEFNYHFTPKSAWMNDPNGLVYYKGEYHLFYQYHPHSTKWGPMHWGHAVSCDLVHWEELSIALYPDELGTIFSGCVVVDELNSSGLFSADGGLVAIFTHAGPDNQKQSLAYSNDMGRTWIKYEGNPVLHNPGKKDFRDPKVFWHQESCKWIMVLACGWEIGIYGSDNLIDWRYLSSFSDEDKTKGAILECPTLMELPVEDSEETRWGLKFDVIGGGCEGQCHGMYFVGSFDGTRFISEIYENDALWSDFGMDFYASQDWNGIPAEDGRKLWIGWMNNWKYAEYTPTHPWRGAMSIPRELSISAGEDRLRVIQRPARELKKLRSGQYTISNCKVTSEDDNILNLIRGTSLEIVCKLRSIHANGFGFKVRVGNEEETVIVFNTVHRKMYIDRTKSGNVNFHNSFGDRHQSNISGFDKAVNIHIFIDEFSVEVFAEEGKVCFTELIFPSKYSNGLSFFVEEGYVDISELSVFKLKSL